MRGHGVEVTEESSVAEEGAFFGLLVFGEELAGGFAAFFEQSQDGLLDTVRLQEPLHGGAEVGEGGEIGFEQLGDGLGRERPPGADTGFEHGGCEAGFIGGEGGHLFDGEGAGDVDQEVGALREAFFVEEIEELQELELVVEIVFKPEPEGVPGNEAAELAVPFAEFVRGAVAVGGEPFGAEIGRASCRERV